MTEFRPSYWETTALIGTPDVIIIGAGFTGLQAALRLKENDPARDVLVLERGALPRGASTRNAGFACFGSPTELLADIDERGEEEVIKTVTARWAGVQNLATNFSTSNIDWEQHGGYEIFDDPQVWQRTYDRLPYLNRLLAPITGERQTWQFQRENLLYNSLEAQLHPGKLVDRLLASCRKAGVRLLFGVEVTEIASQTASVVVHTVSYGEIRARQLLLATNAFARQLLPEKFPALIRPVRNQVMLSIPLPELPAPGCYHYHEGYVYFRNVGSDRLLIGGGRHRAGAVSETDRFGDNPEIFVYLLTKLNAWFPRLGLHSEQFPVRWSGIIAQGDGKAPVLEFATENILVAARLAGMGVALSADLGKRAADLISAGPRVQ